MKNCILGNFRNNSKNWKRMSDSKIKFNKVKNKVVLACLIIQELNEGPVRHSPSVVASVGALVILVKDFYTSLLLSFNWCVIWTRLYFNKIIKKFIIINSEKESTRPTSSNIGRLFAIKWRYWSCLYLGQWIWNRLQVMGSYQIIDVTWRPK